ncbi:putative FAD linked oxidases, C-terminal domain [Lyophyllum shimeji]|uniref:FAD linked oxidases, C-terminal domain n=1 Tax=Lyophyllum shimeji TaxID=47721 RepID=A0A9P3PJ56_LYOSH|nr:putative FAD linked oxidases, C-terminal domain [Lyophyllum shimeji]
MLPFSRYAAQRLALRSSRAYHSRPSALNSVTEQDLAHFAKILPPSSILSTLPPSSASPDELHQYNHDWMGKYHGVSTTVLKPKTTEQVSEIVKWCNGRRIGIVPQGGNTGLVGGSVPIRDEVILSLSNMSKVRSFDPVSGILVADAGCVLQSLTDYVAPHNHIMPIDLGAKGSCQIGGNVATNAGGLRLLRYGSLHGTVLGLEVVLPDGTILDQLTTLRKDNTGYDLKQLFIGAEGTLGVITGVSILTPPAPQASNNVILALPSFKNVLPLYEIVKRQLSEILSAFEYIDRTSYDLAVKHGQGRALSDDEVEGAACFVLVETSGGRREHDEEKLTDLLESLLEAENPLINTGVLSQSPAQFSSLWALREGVTEALAKEGKPYKYDISVPLSSFQEVVDGTREHLRSKGLLGDHAVKHVVGYGHVGDGNLHLNVVAKSYSPEIQAALEPYIYEVVASHRGSVSAEHGIGAMKTHALHYSKSEASIAWMKKLKQLFDPHGIMNPCKTRGTSLAKQVISMPIFQDANGMAVKFFVQKDLPQEIQAELCETITSLGGRVEAKVPRQGYILVQPGTAEEERLRLCWTSPDRPDRHFVPYTYVDACKIAGMLLKQIFVENGQPIGMHIHSSIANVNARSALSQRIMHSGGDPHASAQSARVILADPHTEVFGHLVKTYQGVPDKFIESYLWVKKCIERGSVVYTPLVYKNPGGRRPGEERTQFTEEDEEHLCTWIAAKIPYKETGGRTGNRLYQQLCDLSADPEYAWVTRHTWQSWRERYKKNAARLDAMIAAIVDRKKPAPGEKGQYGYVRQAEVKPKRNRRKRAKTADQAALDDLAEATGMQMVPAMPPMGMQQELQGLPAMQPGMFPQLPAPSSTPLDRASVRRSPAEEEMDEEGQEWMVRIGNAEPPAWAKRKASDEPEGQNGQKRARTDEPGPSAPAVPTGELTPQTLMAIANIHVVDQAIRDIAKDFRFTVEEVQEYYDKCGEMGRTRSRFQKMREQLSNFVDEEEK